MRKKKSIICSIILFLCLLCLYAETKISIQKGETLYSIAKKYEIPLDILLRINRISDVTKINIGQPIIIPEYHLIQKGETLYSLTRKYEIEINSILYWNNLNKSVKLHIGQKIFFISNGSSSKSSPDEEPGTLLWPVNGKIERLNGKLSGVTIFGKEGDQVRSVSKGTVVWAGPYRGYNKMVMVVSPENRIFVYAGNEEILVRKGEVLTENTPIGILGKNPHDGEAKAVFCVYQNRRALDPFKAPRR